MRVFLVASILIEVEHSNLYLFLLPYVLPTAGLVIPTSLQVLDLKRNRLSLTPEGEILQSFDLFWPIFHYLMDCLIFNRRATHLIKKKKKKKEKKAEEPHLPNRVSK